jgi:hypothetical protein
MSCSIRDAGQQAFSGRVGVIETGHLEAQSSLTEKVL